MARLQCRSVHPETRARCERNDDVVGRKTYPHPTPHRAEVGEPDVSGIGRIVEW